MLYPDETTAKETASAPTMRFAIIERLSKARAASRLELYLLAAILFALPTSEAFKNIVLVGFLGTYLVQSVRLRLFGARNPFEIWIWLMLAAMWASMLTSDLRFDLNLAALGERWTLMALSVIFAGRLAWSQDQIRFLLCAFFVGAAMGTAEAFWVWQDTGAVYPHLRSLRHVNSSVLYHLVTIGMALAVLTFASSSQLLKLSALLGLASALVFLVPARSTIGLLAVAIIAVIWLVFAAKATPQGKRLVAFSMVVTVLIGTSCLANAGFRSEIQQRLFSENPLSSRDAIFLSASEVFHHNPILGSGVRTYAQAVSEDRVIAAIEARGEDWNLVESRYFFTNHGHNLVTNTMIERGIVGLILTTGLLLSYIVIFTRSLRKSDLCELFPKGLALGGMLISVGFIAGGLGNTTMTNEHGHAGMLLIAVCASFLRSPTKNPKGAPN